MTTTQLYLIKRDGKPVGAVEGNPQLGGLEWFSVNVKSSSMGHALEHEGYTVEAVDDIDCHDVAALLEAVAERVGVTFEADFVPFSKSRNAGTDWLSLNWKIRTKRGPRVLLETDYSAGSGHCPSAKKKMPKFWDRPARMWPKFAAGIECETGFEHAPQSWDLNRIDRKKPILPSFGDVLHSLILDSAVLDAGGFESWAADYGYDTDSRKAESIYRECLEIALKLRGVFDSYTFTELQLISRFN